MSSDERFLKILYFLKVGRRLDLIRPTSFTAKLQWLKLYWRHDLLTKCADKYAVRDFVSERIGPKYLKKIYGVYERVDEIDSRLFPESFVLKASHGSRQNIFCGKRDEFDWDKTRKILHKYMKGNLYSAYREWSYRDVKPRIICEEHLNPGSEILFEYGFFCFAGQPLLVEINEDLMGRDRITMVDVELRPLAMNYDIPAITLPFQKPSGYEIMIDCAETLAKGFPFVRIDLIEVGGRIFFGEMTFYPWAGFKRILPEALDYRLGSMLALPFEDANPGFSENLVGSKAI